MKRLLRAAYATLYPILSCSFKIALSFAVERASINILCLVPRVNGVLQISPGMRRVVTLGHPFVHKT